MVYSKKDVVKDLKKMGLRRGDICVVRGALRTIGDVDGKRSQVTLDALIEVVGKEGTIVVLSFNSAAQPPLDPDNPDHVFTRNTPSTSGGLSNECLSRPNAVRSKHPLSSFCAIGKDAHFILDGQDEKSSSFYPIGQCLKKHGKLLLIGCINESPGFTTVHWTQWLLGLATRTRKKDQFEIFYIDNKGKKKRFVRKDIGGCSRGFSKFYPYYKKAGVLIEGKIGDAESFLIDGSEALKVEMDLLKKDPTFFLCNNKNCEMCRVGWEFSDTNRLKFWLTNPGHALYRIKSKFKD